MGTKYQVDGDDLTAIANKIRTKGGTSSQLSFPTGFEDAVDAIQTGITPTGTKNIDTNGTHDVTNYASANVAVPASAVDSGTKNINSNGTHDVTGYASANVSVPNTYTQSDEGKVVSSGTLVSQSSDTCTTNGVVDTTLINSLDVNVSGGQAAIVGVSNQTVVFGEVNQIFGSSPTEDVVFNFQDFYVNTHYFYKDVNTGANGTKKITFNCKGFNRTGTSNMNQMFNGCKAFDTVTFNCSVNPWVEMGAYSFAGANCYVENILGTPISLFTYNLQGTTSDSAFLGNTHLKEIRFYENYSRPKIGFPNSSLLSDDSLISLANGLTYASATSTLTLHATSKAKLQNIMGTVSQVTRGNETYDKFTASASGTVTLEDFITTTKGWTIA